MDELTHIKQLLEKFYEGTTSREEEELLERYFTEHEKIPGELAADRELFTSLSSLHRPVDVPADLDEKITDRLSTVQRAETRVRRISIYSFSGLAAGLLLILSVYLGFIRDHARNSIEQYAIEDPERAYLEAKQALMYVSDKWNEGTSELKNLEQVNKGIKSVSTMQKISSGSRELNLLGNLEKAKDIEL